MGKTQKRIWSILCCAALCLSSMGSLNAKALSDTVETEITGEETEDTQAADEGAQTAGSSGELNGTAVCETDDDYQVLEVDDKNRERLVKAGDTYITTDYDDDAGIQTVYYSEGPLNGDNYTEKITIEEIKANEFNSTCIVTTENAWGITIQEYDENDNTTRTVDENGKVTVNQYEGQNLLATISPYTGTSEDELNKVTYQYSNTGNLSEKKTPIEQNEDGSISYYIEKYDYNEYGDLTLYEKSINATGEKLVFSKSEYEYDEACNLIKTTEYDTDGSILAIAQYYYDKDGNRVRMYTGLTDALTITGLDEVTPGKDTEYSVTKYEYENGQLISETDPTGGKETYEYGEDGLLAAKTDKNGNRFEYTYREGTYRESEEIYLKDNHTDTPDEKREYIQDMEEDGSYGMLTQIKEGDSKVSYIYNEDCILTKETDQNGNTISYEYDENQNITKISVEGRQGSIIGETNYSYDKEGRLTAIKDQSGKEIVTYQYDDKNRLTEKTLENGNKIKYEYNAIGWEKSMTVEALDGTLLEDITYEYTVDGNIVKESDQIREEITSYEYDGAGRLIKEEKTVAEEKSKSEKRTKAEEVEQEEKEEVRLEEENTVTQKNQSDETENTTEKLIESGRTLEYTYDESGNRTVITDEEAELESRYDKANRIVSAESGKISYDANGNMTKQGDISYTYNARNQLTEVVNGENVIRYEYDINGKLILREVNGEKEEYIWANDMLVAKITPEGASYYYTELSSDIVAEEQGNNKQYYIAGSRGDIIDIADETGNVTEVKDYESFGAPEETGKADGITDSQTDQREEKSIEDTETGKAIQNGADDKTDFTLGYTGNFYDEAAGLLYLDARFYNPETGTFITEDTVVGDHRETITLNRYAYCKQNPVNYTDDSGHWGSDNHSTQTGTAVSSNGYGSDSTASKCIKFANERVDSYLHYGTDKEKYPFDFNLTVDNEISSQSIKRVKRKELKNYCDTANISNYSSMNNVIRKKNIAEAPYHGKGEYYNYIPYMLGLALQFQKGYQITHLTLRNDENVFQQINFDMLIYMGGLYECEKQKAGGSSISRLEYSYLIMGVALHLAEDMWAHVAVVNDTEAELSKYKSYFKDYEALKKLIYEKKRAISYLELKKFGNRDIEGVSKLIEDNIVEGKNMSSANRRRGYASAAATRLLSFYKAGRIMYSGNKSLTGEDEANATDKKYLARLQCGNGSMKFIYETVSIASKDTEITCARYHCTGCEEGKSDSCYKIFCSDYGSKTGLGYRDLGYKSVIIEDELGDHEFVP